MPSTRELLGSPWLSGLQDPPDVIGLIHGHLKEVSLQHQRLQSLHGLGREVDLRRRLLHLLGSFLLLLKRFLFTRVLAVVAGTLAQVRILVLVIGAGWVNILVIQ